MDSGTRSSSARRLSASPGRRLAAARRRRAGPRRVGAPRRPSDAQSPRPQAAADAVDARIGEIAGQLAAAQAAVDAARAASAIALDDYQATQAAVPGRAAASRRRGGRGRAGGRRPGVARGDVVAFARRSYMDGSTYPGAAALLTAGDPAELIERAALLEAAGAHRSDVLDEVTVLQEQAAAGRRRSPAPRVERGRRAQEQAAEQLAVAQAAEIVGPRAGRRDLAAQQATLQAELAAAQQELQALSARRRPRAGPHRARSRRAPPRRPRPSLRRRPASGNAAPRPAPATPSAAQTAIDAAMGPPRPALRVGRRRQQRPRPGLDPDPGVIGFDCSGLTQYAYAAGRHLDPAQQPGAVRLAAQGVSDDLRPGDLVFWASNPGNPTTIHHVAIYLGNGQIVRGAGERRRRQGVDHVVVGLRRAPCGPSA